MHYLHLSKYRVLVDLFDEDIEGVARVLPAGRGPLDNGPKEMICDGGISNGILSVFLSGL